MEDAVSGSGALVDLAALPALLDRLSTPLDCQGSYLAASEADPRDSDARFLHELARLARRLMQADHVVVRDYGEKHQPGDINITVSRDAGPAVIQQRIDALMSLAARSGRTEIDRSESICLIATVSGQATGQPTVLATALDLGQSSLEPFVVTQQLITSSIATWHARAAQRRERRAQRRQQWITELQESIDLSDTLLQVATHVVDAIAIHIQAHQVALCRQRGDKLSRVEVMAIGGSGTPIGDSLWQAAASESLVRGGPALWPPKPRPETEPQRETEPRPETGSQSAGDDQTVATIALRHLAQSVSPTGCAISVPLRDENGKPLAVLSAVFTDNGSSLPDVSASAAEEFLSVSETVARRVAAWQRTHQTLAQRGTRSLARWAKSRLGFIALVAMVALISMLPVPYRVSGNATVVPHTRSFVVAPHAGLLKATYVRMGDVVQRGAPIAELDDRELRIDMAKLLAERDRAAKQRDIQRADGNVAQEQLAELDLARVDEQIKLTKYRLGNLTLQAPIDGVVLEGELEDVSGAPVETGQLLAEIALLDRLWIEIDVREEELSEIRVGQELRVALDADSSVIKASVESISPSARVRNGQNVFVVRGLLENSAHALRPGTSGMAKIDSDDRPLVAVILRHAWRRISRLWI